MVVEEIKIGVAPGRQRSRECIYFSRILNEIADKRAIAVGAVMNSFNIQKLTFYFDNCSNRRFEKNK